MPGIDLRRQMLLIAAFAIAYGLITVFVQHSYYLLILTVVPVWAVMGLSWNLLSGYSGFVSFGHAAFFGLGAYVNAATDAQAREVAEEALAQVGLQGDAQRLAGTLTNKQMRLLEIARALAGKPRLLLLDETLAGLGAGEVDEVIAVVRKLAAQGITIVIIEHTMQAMVRLVDRFVVLNEGALLAEGLPQDITRDTAVIDAYLGKRWRIANA